MSDEQTEKKQKNGMAVKIYAAVITTLLAAAICLVIYLLIAGGGDDEAVEAGAPVHKDEAAEAYYTAKQMAELLEAERSEAYAKAYEESERAMLDNIKAKMSTGTTTLSLLRELYPEYLVYSEKGGYVFGEILDLPKNSFKDGDFSYDKEDNILSYAGKEKITTHMAIDVSKYQGTINWGKVKASGVEYVFIRVGLRGYGTGAIVEDENYASNIKGATDAGLKVGVYFFSEAVSEAEAVEEAEFILERIKDYDIALPVVMDIEEIPDDDARNEALTKDELTRVALAFMKRVEKAGYAPMLYGNIKCLVSMVDIEKLSDYDIWYAFYSDNIYIPYEVAGWQYSGSGSIDGVKGECDLNIFFKEWD